jgi:alkyldihydroxyacetonephosphate synthase
VEANRGAPTPPIAFAGTGPVGVRIGAPTVDVAPVLDRLRSVCSEVVCEPDALAEASRDWWPLAMVWALADQVGGLGGAIARPADAAEVAEVIAACSDAGIPVTPVAGRSGVCGASVPVFGGVLLDTTRLDGIVGVDDASLTVEVLPGTFGDVYEDSLRERHGLTGGHLPQSIALSTVGGWLACRGAGQLSTRYGKIEDLVVGLEVALADGRVVRTGGAPRAAVGPDLTQLFVGCEGTLGVITRAWLRAFPLPAATRSAAYGFSSFEAGLDAMRRVLRRGATPAVFRLYDAVEADRSYSTGDRHLLLVLDEADGVVVDATMRIVDEECAAAEPLDAALVGQWMGHRNDVSALEALVARGYVVDTMEVSAPWSRLAEVYTRTTSAIAAVEHALVASAHQSHSYLDGPCLYFTFAGQPPADERERFYRAAWDAGTRAALGAGAALSHHHGVGLNRARFVREALGDAFDVLAAVKTALDPRGVLNPGKLGLPSPFGADPGP